MRCDDVSGLIANIQKLSIFYKYFLCAENKSVNFVFKKRFACVQMVLRYWKTIDQLVENSYKVASIG